jgi:adenylate cyclase
MGAEIERKYLVKNTLWKPKVETSIPITQGYITRRGNASVRVRLTDKNAFVTLKGARNGIQRAEYEYPIPREDAEEMLATLAHQPLVEKTRHLIPNGNHVWVMTFRTIRAMLTPTWSRILLRPGTEWHHKNDHPRHP